ncbi:olfactory receptor 10AG1-like [Chionomys nivalis]|uniref:olfactory receptor 10AG1-like n=1 Tax=Chionomys nivalis TaxID=269649 RepID=UPI002596143C|nr:olfactory receptor 10AG1-like [Chionomys nivalis]
MKHTNIMEEDNISTVTQFLLLGFSDLPNLQGLLFGMFSIMYVIILFGNSFIIVITRIDPSLHNPMYFFLSNFSFLEICYVSVTLPRVLYSIWTQDRSISLLACATQMCFFLILAATDSILLAVMSYDRYVAICNPLHYPLVMNQKKCTQLAVGSWLGGMPFQLGQTCQIFSLHFCNSNLIDHFFCDIPPVLKLACGDTSVNELYAYAVVILLATIPFLLILTSYSKIIATILKLPTAEGRAKAFSTCSSHLVVVILFYGSASITYLMPKSRHSALSDKLLSLFYTVVTPMFNPMIYSLRNKEVIAALKRLHSDVLVWSYDFPFPVHLEEVSSH